MGPEVERSNNLPCKDVREGTKCRPSKQRPVVRATRRLFVMLRPSRCSHRPLLGTSGSGSPARYSPAFPLADPLPQLHYDCKLRVRHRPSASHCCCWMRCFSARTTAHLLRQQPVDARRTRRTNVVGRQSYDSMLTPCSSPGAELCLRDHSRFCTSSLWPKLARSFPTVQTSLPSIACQPLQLPHRCECEASVAWTALSPFPHNRLHLFHGCRSLVGGLFSSLLSLFPFVTPYITA